MKSEFLSTLRRRPWLLVVPVLTACGETIPLLQPGDPSIARQAMLSTVQTGQWYRVCQDSMALARANPDASSAILGMLQSNTAFWIQQVSQDMRWVWANTQDNTVRGWIPAEFVCDYWQSAPTQPSRPPVTRPPVTRPPVTTPEPPITQPEPPVTQPPASGDCDTTRFACGPFPEGLRKACRLFGGGETCNTDRWDLEFHQKLKGYENAGGWNKKIVDYYSVKANYDKVHTDVMGWYGTTKNGCVAFMSTAMRHVGVSISKSEKLDGNSVSLWVPSFSKFMEQKLQWIKFDKHEFLEPGDVVISEGFAHTYMFQGWKNQAKGLGLVVDNQGFTHERNIFGYGSGNFTPWKWAFRSKD